MHRKNKVVRKTKETNISLDINIDGSGKLTGDIPIPFFHHMLQHLCKYSLINLNIDLKGDLEIDCHHSVEDTAICLGTALKQALGDKSGIFRFGHCTLTMDEVLTTTAVDISGRPYFSYQGKSLNTMGKFGIYDSELTLEFLHKLSIHSMMNLHVLVHYGENRHHIHESIFKSLGFALRHAVTIDEKRKKRSPFYERISLDFKFKTIGQWSEP